MSDHDRHSSFVDYFNEYTGKRRKSNADEYQMSVRYFIAFAGHGRSFLDIDDFFCEDYKKFLLSGPALSKRKKKITTNTAVSYFAKFRSCLRQAYKQGLLTTDLFSRVDAIKPRETHREQLEIEEFQLLANTPIKSQVVKRAAIFSGLTGLRFSDVRALRWSEVRGTAGKFYLQFIQEKTADAETLPISDQAVEILGKRGLPGDKVFKGFSYSGMRTSIAHWLNDAGIEKNITFHSFRHTFATLQLEFGTEIYTVSKMLGHRSIKTTQIYAKVKDKKKFEAANKIKLDMNWMSEVTS